MISIIICTRENFISEVLTKNIKDTIGYLYELIVIDNSKCNYSIFEAYNIGIEKSQGKYWCFIHDDVFFHNQGWGKVLINIFEEESKIGVIGIAGAKMKSKIPSAWWDCPEEFKVINLLQHTKEGKIEHWYQGWQENKKEQVIVIDGVFMAVRRIDDFCFSNIFEGFHNYDLNLCFEYLKRNYIVVVTKDIIIEHFSIGNLNKDWLKSTMILHKNYDFFLPLSIKKIDGIKCEIFAGKKWVDSCIRIEGRKKIHKYILFLFSLRVFSKIQLNLLKYSIKRVLKK